MSNGVTERQQLLTSAKADLLKGAEHPNWVGVPRHVAASWQRSKINGVEVASVESPYFSELDYQSRMVKYALPIIDRLVKQVAHMPICVALTDNRARILVRRDTGTWIGNVLDSVQFAQGFGYDERAVGTNGVGTVLEFGEAVHIVGAEHYADALAGFACAGAPVRDPFTGRIEGVLDLTCLDSDSTPIMYSLVSTAADAITQGLLFDRNQAQQALLDVYCRIDSRTRQAVAAVGPSFVLDNAAAQALLEPADRQVLHEHMRFLSGSRSVVDDIVNLPSGAVVRLRGSSVAVGTETAGMVGVISQTVRQLAFTAPGRDRKSATTELGLRNDGLRSILPSLHSAELIGRSAIQTGAALLVLGESGSGRSTFLGQLARIARPNATVTVVSPADFMHDAAYFTRRMATANAEEEVYILAELEQVDEDATRLLMACLAEHKSSQAILGATSTDSLLDGRADRLLSFFGQSVTLPPLRYRISDLPQLVTCILRDAAPQRSVELSPDALRVLNRYRWPGNIAELRSVLLSALKRRPVGTIRPQDLPAFCQTAPKSALRPVDQLTRDAIVDALNRFDGNRQAAARDLGLARSTIYRKIREYGITT